MGASGGVKRNRSGEHPAACASTSRPREVTTGRQRKKLSSSVKQEKRGALLKVSRPLVLTRNTDRSRNLTRPGYD